MQSDDVQSMAEWLVLRFGDDASQIALKRATALARLGNRSGAMAWTEAAALADELHLGLVIDLAEAADMTIN